jgi:Flp pilus assembly protein TadG
MAGKTKKIILAGTLGLILIATFIGYTLYNKQHFSVADATPAAALTAAELHNTFATDSVTARAKFIGDETNHKVIEVSGEVADISTNQQQHSVIKLKTATDGAFINCEMEAVISSVKSFSSLRSIFFVAISYSRSSEELSL